MRLSVLFLFLLLLGSSIDIQAQSRRKKKRAAKIEAQWWNQYYNELPGRLKNHVFILASDSLEGRRTGTRGEALAADYISRRFAEIGLNAAGDNGGWLQWFEVNEGREFESGSYLMLNGKKLEPGVDFFPLNQSASAQAQSVGSPVLPEENMPRFLDLKEELEKNKTNPHYDISGYISQKITEFVQKKASSVIIYNSGSIKDGLIFDPKSTAEPVAVPVVYVQQGPAKIFKNESEPVDLELKIDISNKKRKGSNIVGRIDNNAAQTVIIGAHFDHLGYGEDHNSLYTGKSMQIHNGADDNASGSSALIETARLLKMKGPKNFNYLFVAFSGEELGLYGSKHFAENPGVDLARVDYMINMDMVGRLNDSTKTLTIGGYGTSPAWAEIIGGIPEPPVKFKFDSSGTGPSDHTSFYRKNLPVLFFFTGTHSDYHKPGDDAEKINYNGMAGIVKLLYTIVNNSGSREKLAFTKTREASPGSSTRFTVSLGIMPDYTFSGTGVRVDGVSEGKLAEKLGVQAGDVLTQLGDFKIESVQSYMQALGKFRKGDNTKLTLKRGEKELVFAVTF